MHPLETLSERYLKEKNLATATLKSYRIAFKKFIAYLNENAIEYAKTSDVVRYREIRRDLGHSSHYIYIDISALKGLYAYLKANQKALNLPKQYAYNIMEPIKNERIKHRIKKTILSPAQAKDLILYTKDTRKHIWHYRDHAIFYVMLMSGLRPVEIIRAKRSDYQTREGMPILYIQGSTQNAFVKLSKGAMEALNDYLYKRQDDNPYLFIAHRKPSTKNHLSRTFFKDMFLRVLKSAGLDGLNITPHCLRHTAAIMNLLRGASIEETRMLMRHAKIQSTLVYKDYMARLNDDSEFEIEKFILKEDDDFFGFYP